MNKTVKAVKPVAPMKADEVMKAAYLVKPMSRVQAFKNSPRAYKVNPDGSVSSAWELNYFNN